MISNNNISSCSGRIAVFGATGHTGRFVVAELLRRGCVPVLVARDAARLEAFRQAVDQADGQPLETRVASIDDLSSLDRAFHDVAVVINCAGPFLDTAQPVIEAALRVRANYLDVTAEQGSAQDTFERFDSAAKEQNIVVAPAMAFYGGLADLMVTALMQGWDHADTLEIGIALDSWMPTLGTRLTGKRNTARRLVVAGGQLVPLADPLPQSVREFPAPFGTQDVMALPFTEIITISKHLRIANVNTFINLTPIKDIRNPDTPPPVAEDEYGRSNQVFMLDALVSRGDQTRRVTVRGHDIYAVTAPIVVEAAVRILDGRAKTTGARAAGELFDVRDFLNGLSPEHLAIEFDPVPSEYPATQ